MKPKDFKRWRKSLGLSQKTAAERLGLKRRVVQYYEKGERDGKDVEVPKAVRLACYALTEGVSDYHGPREAAERNAEPTLRLVANGAAHALENGAAGAPEAAEEQDGKKTKRAKSKEKDKDKDKRREKDKKDREKGREKSKAKAKDEGAEKPGKTASPDDR